MEIRELSEGDLASIKELDTAIFSADEQYDDAMYPRMLQGSSLVAVDGETIVGYAFVQRDPGVRDALVRSLAVHPAYRRRGFGEALLRAVVDTGREIDLLVDETNEPAMRLYEKLGFERAEMCLTTPPKRRMVYVPNGRGYANLPRE